MAHAGTTIDQLQQPTKTGSGKQMGWLALITAAVILALGLAIGATQLNIGSNPAGFAPADRSYDQAEQLRGGASLPGALDDRGHDNSGGRRGGAQSVPVTPAGPVAPAGPVQNRFEHAPGKGQLP